MASVSIIIVNYNAGERLLKCLAAVKAQTHTPLEVLLVDNDSEDGSFLAALEAHPWVTPMPMGENLGFAAANNRAAELARGDWLALLNPDAYPEPDWLEELLHASGRWPTVAAFGSTQIQADDVTVLDGAGDNLHALGVPYRGFFGWSIDNLPKEGKVFAPCAAAALIQRDRFLELGGFDESFFCYCEDVDWGFRHRLSGGECIQVPAARVMHEGSGITGRQSAFTMYHGHRNRLWMWAKNAPPLLFWGLLPVQLLANGYFLTRFLSSDIWSDYQRALIDGYREFPKLRRHARRGHTSGIAAALTWSPLALSKRQGKTRP